MILKTIGWNNEWEKHFNLMKDELRNTGKEETEYIPGRIKTVFKDQYKILTENGEVDGITSGKMSYEFLYAAKYPTVGDWVILEENPQGPCRIHGILPRKGVFQRQEAGGSLEAQLIAANVDQCFIMQTYGNDFNLARMDRYITLAWNSGALPIVVLTKADLAKSEVIQEMFNRVNKSFPEIEVISVSALTGQGFEEFQKRLTPGKTHMVLGSSGVGKSTTLNRLLGKVAAKTKEVRESDQRGKHTTTHREMYLLDNGGMYIDTPGMRELALFRNEGMEESFQDVIKFGMQCRFKDCSHKDEPGCEVQNALEKGELSADRLKSYQKLLNEKKRERSREIRLQKKRSKEKIKKNKVHYKDFVRNG